MNKQPYKEQDPALYACIAAEEERQQTTLEMIASESIQPKEVLALSGGVFNNKTAVGRIGHQRLLGSQNADALEALAAARACEIFGADHAIMSTYSGSVSNFCAYAAVLRPGERALAMDPKTGAHQSHGAKGNISSTIYDFSFFGLEEDTLDIDYADAEKKAKALSPKLMVIGSAAYPRTIDYERLAHIAHFTGLAAAGVSPNPVPYADIVTASTTKTMCGPHSGFILCKSALAEAVEKSIYPGYVSSLHLQTVAAMAYTLRRSQTPEFGALMRAVVSNAKALCAALQKRGFAIFTGGTDCHLFLLDLRPYGMDGVRFAEALEQTGITTNSKAIPYDPSPVPMGIRAGTTVLTQRGMREKEMEEIAEIYAILAKNQADEKTIAALRPRVRALADAFPIRDL